MSTSQNPQPFSRYQGLIVALLAFLQFTVILDFMVLSPLGAMIMPALTISPFEFAVLVSGYAFSAGAAGLLAAGFADRFDRKRMLLFFYAGFLLGTLLCAVAGTYHSLLLARIVTGMFGGVIGSIVLAVAADLFDYRQRGRVMGVVQAAFAASNVLGLPIGLYLANRWSWHAPFYLIVIIGAAVGVVIVVYLRPIDAHLQTRPDKSPLHHFIHSISTPRYIQGFAATMLLTSAGFMLLPFNTAFTVHNLGINIDRLPLIFMVSGIVAMLCGPLIGRASDAIGNLKVFLAGCAANAIIVPIFTNLGITPINTVIFLNMLIWIGVSARMISSAALISAVPSVADRGSYMSISSSMQQFSGGIATVLAGLIVKEAPSGAIEHLNTVGYVVVATTLLTALLMYFINRTVESSAPLAPVSPSAT